MRRRKQNPVLASLINSKCHNQSAQIFLRWSHTVLVFVFVNKSPEEIMRWSYCRGGMGRFSLECFFMSFVLPRVTVVLQNMKRNKAVGAIWYPPDRQVSWVSAMCYRVPKKLSFADVPCFAQSLHWTDQRVPTSVLGPHFPPGKEYVDLLSVTIVRNQAHRQNSVFLGTLCVVSQ